MKAICLRILRQITTLHVLTVVLFVVLVIGPWAHEHFKPKPRVQTPRSICINNLRQIEGAKEQWGIEGNMALLNHPQPKDLYGPGNYIKQAPKCPLGGIYTIGVLTVRPTCSFPGHSL